MKRKVFHSWIASKNTGNSRFAVFSVQLKKGIATLRRLPAADNAILYRQFHASIFVNEKKKITIRNSRIEGNRYMMMMSRYRLSIILIRGQCLGPGTSTLGSTRQIHERSVGQAIENASRLRLRVSSLLYALTLQPQYRFHVPCE